MKESGAPLKSKSWAGKDFAITCLCFVFRGVMLPRDQSRKGEWYNRSYNRDQSTAISGVDDKSKKRGAYSEDRDFL